MRLKKFALRGLIILAVAVALCMFFARTVQTITTPKVQLVTGSSGRYEEKMKFQAQVFFPEEEEIVVEEARDLGVVVKRIYVKPGHRVLKGDVIFTAEAGDTEAKMKELREQYDTKNAELIELDVKNRKSSQESRQNDLYNAMLEAQDALTEASFAARMAAVEAGIILVGDVAQWEQQLALVEEVPQAVGEAVTDAQSAKATADAAKDAFNSLMEDRKVRVKDEVFEYIKTRDGLLETLDDLAQQMVEMASKAQAVKEVRAPRDGYISAVEVTEGEPYDGIKTAYKMNAQDVQPILRAPIDQDERVIAEGTKTEIQNEIYGTESSVVTETAVSADGSKYLYIAMPERYLESDSSAIRRVVSDGGVEVVITYRARQSTTLLPTSAVRNEGEGSDYVYLIQRDWGGFMSGSTMKVVKTNVTVLERGDKTVSIAEDLSWQEVADREDRMLADGQTVMEYVD